MWIRATISSLILAVATDSTALAQQQPAGPAAPARTQATTLATASIEFSGGTLEQYVNHVKTRFSNANVVIDNGFVATIQLPTAKLPRVTLPVAMQWVLSAADARVHNLALRMAREGREPNEVYVFTYAIVPPRVAPVEDFVVKTYHIAALPEGGADPTLVTNAVNDALQKQRTTTKGTAEYKQVTRNIIVSGSRSDIIIADRVVEEMTRSARVAAAIPRMQDEIDRLRAEVADLKLESDPEQSRASWLSATTSHSRTVHHSGADGFSGAAPAGPPRSPAGRE